ncbi:MAG: T9SS type A sorting domain-containing protein [Bacteroidota bacterium]
MNRLRYAALAVAIALAAPVQAQDCSGTEADDILQGTSPTTIDFGTNPANSVSQELGQSFTSPCNGRLDFFRVLYSAPNTTSEGVMVSGNAILFEGAGTAGQTIATEPFSFTLPNVEGGNPLTVTFPNAPVSQGSIYTIFFDITSGDQLAKLLGSSIEAYDGGAMFASNSGSAEGAGVPGTFDLTFRARFGETLVASEEAAESRTVSILPPRPNPAVGRTLVPFTLRQPADVQLAVYDALGREVALVADRGYSAGEHVEPLDTSDFAPGTYVVRLVAGPDVVLRTISVTR